MFVGQISVPFLVPYCFKNASDAPTEKCTFPTTKILDIFIVSDLVFFISEIVPIILNYGI